MKKKFAIISFALTFVMVSCDDFIENPQRGKQTLDNYFQTEEECQNFVNGLYARLLTHDDWWQLLGPRLVNEAATDDAWMGNTQQSASDYYPAAHYAMTPTLMGNIGNIYRIRFENISNCNYAINGITQSPVNPAAIPGMVAQAKFCRAMNYYELVNNYGGVPLITEPIFTGDMNRERASKEEVYQQIFNDLKDASAALKYQTSAEANGQATKGAAQSLLARAYLFAGDYANAFLYADSVIKCGKYALESDFINIWNVYNHNGVESIFEIQSSDVSDKSLGAQISTLAGARGEKADKFPSADAKDVMDGWGWCMPTSNLENCYLSENDEIRRRSTIIRYLDPVYGDETNNPSYYFNPEANKSMRVIRKYYIPVAMRRTLTDKRMNAPLNIPLLRLAEMYLTRAEAAYFLNNPSQALADLNTVRDRVFLEPKTGLSGNSLLYAIWKERRMELAFEGIRLYDIRREIDPVTNKPVIESIMGPNGSFVKYNTQTSIDEFELGNTMERQDKGIMFDASKHLLWPVPQSEIDRSMGTVEQNPGYN
jgi:hypothetical protein